MQPPAPTPSVAASVMEPAIPVALLEPVDAHEMPALDGDGEWGYAYTAIVGDGPVEGPTMIASTGGDGAPDYELNKAVLDRIMASIRFDR